MASAGLGGSFAHNRVFKIDFFKILLIEAGEKLADLLGHI